MYKHTAMLRRLSCQELTVFCRILPRHKSAVASVKVDLEDKKVGASFDIEPPLRKQRDALSVLRALADSHVPAPNEYSHRINLDRQLIGNPGDGAVQAKIAGKLAARVAIRDFVPDAIGRLATELPRIDAFMPIEKAERVVDRLESETISVDEAMSALIDLLAPKHASDLYIKFKDHKWDPETLHKLLELLCRTSHGKQSDNYMFGFRVTQFSEIPDADELFIKVPTYDKDIGHSLFGCLRKSKKHSANVKHNAELTPQKLASNHQDILSSNRALASLIKGACLHDQFSVASKLFHKNRWSPFNRDVYETLLKHMVSNSPQNVTKDLLKIYNSMVFEGGHEASGKTFEAMQHALSVSLRDSGESSPEVLEFSLGLYEHQKSLGISMTLGFYANLLATIHYSAPQNKAYDTQHLVREIVEDLEQRWASGEAPSKDEYLSEDSLMLFPVLLDTCYTLKSIPMMQRVDHLLRGESDRRYLIRDNHTLESYLLTYCTASFTLDQIGTFDNELEKWKNISALIDRIGSCYHKHSTICTTQCLQVNIVRRLIQILSSVGEDKIFSVNQLSDMIAHGNQIDVNSEESKAVNIEESEMESEIKKIEFRAKTKGLVLLAAMLRDRTQEFPIHKTVAFVTRIIIAYMNNLGYELLNKMPDLSLMDIQACEADLLYYHDEVFDSFKYMHDSAKYYHYRILNLQRLDPADRNQDALRISLNNVTYNFFESAIHLLLTAISMRGKLLSNRQQHKFLKDRETLYKWLEITRLRFSLTPCIYYSLTKLFMEEANTPAVKEDLYQLLDFVPRHNVKKEKLAWNESVDNYMNHMDSLIETLSGSDKDLYSAKLARLRSIYESKLS